MKINILGSYITQFGELYEKSLTDLLQEATTGVLTDAQLAPEKIEAIFVANKAGGSFNGQRHLNALASEQFSHCPPAMRVEGACASGSLAVLAAEQALLSGLYQTVLVLGVEKMTDVLASESTTILATAADHDLEAGSTFPALYALLANYHQAQFGTSRDDLSAVVVKNHRHALTNPKAQFHKEFTIAQVSQSALVADPLRVLDCSPISDGAAALILTTKKCLAQAKISGFGQGQDVLALSKRWCLSGLNATRIAVKKALQMSQFSLNTIQAAEVHDCFSIAEVLAVEDLGFCALGQGGAWLQTLDEKQLIINPSGGLKACGHPVGATGVKQIAYLSQQIALGRFDHALAHNVGGSGATAVVHCLEKA